MSKVKTILKAGVVGLTVAAAPAAAATIALTTANEKPVPPASPSFSTTISSNFGSLIVKKATNTVTISTIGNDANTV
ncbi:hypothetical protein Barb6_03808 [Bacteroidales bacterium Barb6]|nr:hypothetical protein Barb6_03808 [Bacteroidales bacterium Barb6]